MRVLMTTDCVGGVWTMTRMLTEQLLLRGHAVALVSFGRMPAFDQQKWVDYVAAVYGDAFVFRASDAPLEWMQNNEGTFGEGADLLLRVADDFEADVLHSNQFCWGALSKYLPCVVTAHSDVLSWAAACRPEDIENSVWLERYRLLVQRGLDGADAITAPTKWMRNALYEHYDVTRLVSVIANGRNVPDERVVERKMQAVSVGRLWDDAKGLKTLSDVAAPMPILIAGEETFDGSRTLTGGLQALGVLAEAELLQLFWQSSIYVATSIYEPFGLAPLEAALCGCAIVARNIPSLREVWGDAAIFFDTPGQLEQLLQMLADDPERLQDAQKRARARAQSFTVERMVEDFKALYETVRRPIAGAPLKGIRELASHVS